MVENSLKPTIGILENLFSKLNEHFYDGRLIKPIITVSPDTTKGAYGWCTHGRVWQQKNTLENTNNSSNASKSTANNSGYYEINLCADYLNRSFEEIVTTLLHEMVHLYNLQIGVKDTSRSGTYHNKQYKIAAEQHGLIVERDPKYGYTLTSLNDEARNFTFTLPMVTLSLHRLKTKGNGYNKQSTRKLVCPSCGSIIRVTKMNINVICGDCLVHFQEDWKHSPGENQ